MSQRHFDQCAFGTPWKLRTKLIASHCFDFRDTLSLAECTSDEHHVCAVNYVAKISVDDSLQHVTPPLLQAVQYYLFQGNWKQMTPSLLCLQANIRFCVDLGLCGHISRFLCQSFQLRNVLYEKK